MSEERADLTGNESGVWQNELLTVQEVAAYFRVSRTTVWRWCQTGRVPAIRVGRNWRIQREGLLRLAGDLSEPRGD